MIKKKLAIILIVGMMTLSLFAEPFTSNSVSYELETLTEPLKLRTTEKGMILLQNNSSDSLFEISKRTKEQLGRIVGGYTEIDAAATISNYKTINPPFIKSSDNKTIQFKMIHTIEPDETIIVLRIDMEGSNEYKEPIEINFSLEHLNSLLNLLDEGFSHMDSVKAEILKLRKMEEEIRNGSYND